LFMGVNVNSSDIRLSTFLVQVMVQDLSFQHDSLFLSRELKKLVYSSVLSQRRAVIDAV